MAGELEFLGAEIELAKVLKVTTITKPAVLAVHAHFESLPTHRAGSIGPE